MNNTHNTNKTSIYYSKYIKYKNKYNKLKQLQGGNIKVEKLSCGAGGCAFKITIDEKIYVLKGIKYTGIGYTDNIITQMFINELLKGVELSILCDKEENKEMKKYFSTPIYFPIYSNNTVEGFIEEVKQFYTQIYNNAIIYYKKISKMNESDNLSIMADTTIDIDKIISCIDVNIRHYTTYIFSSLNVILQQVSTQVIINNLWYITEYGGKDLFDFCKETDILINITIYEKILKQIHETMNFLHSNNIYHCDLRPDNICYDGENIKIIDFGYSHNSNELDCINKSDVPIYKNNNLITGEYIPPEIYTLYIANGLRFIPYNSILFNLFYMTKSTNKILKHSYDYTYNRYMCNISMKELPYSQNIMKSYYSTYKFKWVDYICVGLSFLNFFLDYALQNQTVLAESNNEDAQLFIELCNILLSWCIVDFRKRSDIFNVSEKRKFNLIYNNMIHDFSTDYVKPSIYIGEKERQLLNYYEFIYQQLI